MSQIDIATSQVYRTVQIVNLSHNELRTNRINRRMARTKTKDKKRQKGQRKLNRRLQSEGKIPWVMNFKKGLEVTKHMIKAVNCSIDVDKAKRTVEGYKQQYRANK